MKLKIIILLIGLVLVSGCWVDCMDRSRQRYCKDIYDTSRSIWENQEIGVSSSRNDFDFYCVIGANNQEGGNNTKIFVMDKEYQKAKEQFRENGCEFK